MKVTLDHIQDETPNIRTFYFRPERPVQFTAGQFAEWTLKHPRADGRGSKRWFTISSSPSDELVTITTKRATDNPLRGGSSFKEALFQLKPGDEVLMSESMGDFVLPKLIQTPLVFVAGGIGITPFHSILSWLNATSEQRSIKLLYAVRNEDEIIFQETFDKASIVPAYIVGEPSDSWGGERGQLSAKLILGLGKPDENSLVYVSGPEPMVEKLEKDLHKAGLRKDQFIGDFFPNYTSV